MVFTRAHDPGFDPILFLNGHRVVCVPQLNFLGVILDQKLLWRAHIDSLVRFCLASKNIFSVDSNAKYGPPTRSFSVLF